MKTVMTFFSKTEADMGAGLLQANGIRTNIVGAQEYTSIVTGSGEGRYELKVGPADFQAATDLLAAVQEPQVVAPAPSGEPNFFGRAIFLAAVAIVVLPVIANIGSLLNLKKFWASSQKDSGAVAKLILGLALQIPSIFVLKFFLRSIFG